VGQEVRKRRDYDGNSDGRVNFTSLLPRSFRTSLYLIALESIPKLDPDLTGAMGQKDTPKKR
jgi:hypothetical protein